MAERCLDDWLSSVLGGSVRADLLELVCSECLQPIMIKDMERGERVCKSCGFSVLSYGESSDEFATFLDRDVTFAPSSFLSWNKWQGNTLDFKKYLHRVLRDPGIPFEKFRKMCPQIAAKLKDGAFVISDCYVFQLSMSKDVVRLCRCYDFDGSNSDQPFYGTLGQKIREIKKVVVLIPSSHISNKVLVESTFYLCLLLCGKKKEAEKAKKELQVDPELINLYANINSVLRRLEQQGSSQGSRLLEVLEAKCADKTEYFSYLRLIESKLRKGSVVVADNAGLFARQMAEYFEYLRNSGNYISRYVQVGYDGLEISVKL